MLNNFTTARIIFGRGARLTAAHEAGKFGRRCALVTGASGKRVQWLADALSAVMDEVVPVCVADEPDIHFAAENAEKVRRARCDVVVAVGGGSVLDVGKALAALAGNTRDILDYLEVVGRGMALEAAPLPVIAIPTTSGTGSEVTANAVLSVPGQGAKVSLRSVGMIPRLAVVDPELALTLPPSQTLSTGLDALTQLIEAFVSHARNPLTAPLCREGISRVRRSLERAVRHGDDIGAREDMALASLFSGIALANGKLGAVHGFAAPLGAMLNAPHGALCAALLPHVMAVNIAELRHLSPAAPALDAYGEVSRILCGESLPEAGVRWIQNLGKELGVLSLNTLGAIEACFDEYALAASRASSMRGNPVELDQDALKDILRRACSL